MVKRVLRSAAVGGLLAAAPVRLTGQTGSTGQAADPHPCDAQTGKTKLVCRAGYDGILAIIPAGALAVSGGNPSLGTAGGGTGFGNIGLTFRANFVRVVLPATGYDATTDTVAAARRLPVPVPSLDIRFGLLRKVLPAGTATVDFLGSLTGIPERATDYIRFADDDRRLAGLVLGFGWGLRIGVQPKGPLPVVSLNIGRHDVPKFSVGDLSAGSNFAYTVAISAINARLMVGTRLKGFEFTAGAGADLMKGAYSVVYRNMTTRVPAPRADSTASTMRIVTVANGAFLLGRGARLTFEGGFQVGKDDKLPTIFAANNTKSGRFFGGVGLGFKL